jgi:(1->4)-alpha-D-glucan 1-alpha-D-glucosylmutase
MPRSTKISATYRLQFNKDFRFQDAAKLLDYFSELGITHIYASPILRSRTGSTHGYDVIDPTRLNPELGAEADFQAFQTELQKRGMGLILDIVPNHMSASSENAWWMDVLENGRDSAYASYFDVDWHPPSRSLEGKILLPVLGRPFGAVLESQELKLAFFDGRFHVQYFDSLFPLAPQTYRRILAHHTAALKDKLGENSAAFQEYAGIIAALAALSNQDATKAGAVGERRLQFEAVRERLRGLASNNADVQSFIDQNLRELEGRPRDPASFSLLERLLSEQFYALSYWQNVNEEINYRRFFTITDLVGVRIEDPVVFAATHNLVRRLVEQGAASGLRIDHIDGLRDPLAYLTRINEQIVPAAPFGGSQKMPIFAEKILERSEHLRRDWPVAGTTGYDFLNAMNHFFVDPQGAKRIEEIYSTFLGKPLTYDDLLYQKKRLVMSTLLGVEMRSLGHQLSLLADKDRYARELSRNDLTNALIETTACLPVYRTYIRNLEVAAEDARVIEHAIKNAQARKFYLQGPNFSFVRDVLLLKNHAHLLPDQREARLTFVMRWQQFTGPIMAKAFEDIFLYVYHPLASLNEVGGDPRPSAAQSADFFKFVQERAKLWPNAMNASTSHDTKRSEDIRARINVLSEIPAEWQAHLSRWSKWNAKHKKLLDGQLVPDRNEEVLLYQTLLGVWLTDDQECDKLMERLQAYAIKATREAMVHTQWTRPNVAHENALKRFITSVVKYGNDSAFVRDLREFQERIAYHGMINGLSQTLLKITCPGIPDFYQGSELWDLRLVDPDNRQPVDFSKRTAMLARIKKEAGQDLSAFAGEVTRNWRDGRVKLYLIWKALTFRREHADFFSRADFIPLACAGDRRDNVAAFARRYKREWMLAVVPRWLARAASENDLAGSKAFWNDTQFRLPRAAPCCWRNVFTNEDVSTDARRGMLAVGQVLGHFPVALLSGRQSEAKRRKSQH